MSWWPGTAMSALIDQSLPANLGRDRAVGAQEIRADASLLSLFSGPTIHGNLPWTRGPG